MSDSSQNYGGIHRRTSSGSIWAAVKGGSRPSSASGDRVNATSARTRSRVTPSTPVGSNGDAGTSPTRIMLGYRSQVMGGGRTAATTPITAAASSRVKSGRLQSLQARRLGSASVSGHSLPHPDAQPPRTAGEARGHGNGPESEPTFHSFGIMGRSMSDVAVHRSPQRSVRVAGTAHGLVATPAFMGATRSSDLQRANSEMDPQHRQTVPGLTPIGISPDGVIMCEASARPGEIFVQRTRSSRASNPERLNLDRRSLTKCCCLLGEEHLRLLNYQHNNITAISNLQGMPNLVFLDLYANSISDLTPLSSAPSLRVLMLGRNSIRAVKGLGTLKKLDVLDLHNNLIDSMEGIHDVAALRILNLAGNQIRRIEDLSSLSKLAELNLRRNLLTSLCAMDEDTDERNCVERGDLAVKRPHSHWPPVLQRLFVSHNRIVALEELRPLADMGKLQEVALDGNPISSMLHPREYRKKVLAYCPPELKILDMVQLEGEEAEVLLDAQEGRVAAAGGRETPAKQKAQADLEGCLSPQAEESDSFGYGVIGTAAPIQPQANSTKQDASPALRTPVMSVVHRNGVIRRYLSLGEQGSENIAAPGGHGTRARERDSGGGGLDSAASSRTFSGDNVSDLTVSAEMSKLWEEEDSDDSETELSTVIEKYTGGHRGNPADLVIARRKQQVRQMTDGGLVSVGVSAPLQVGRPSNSMPGAGTSQARLQSPNAAGGVGVARVHQTGGQGVKLDEQGGGSTELFDDGRCIRIYGKAFQTLQQPSSLDATEVSIMYLPPGELADTSPVLAAMGNLKALILNENNISYLHQLDMLAPLAQVTSLNIGSGNPVRDLVLFRPYLIWRMPHLEVLNGAIVTAKEREESVQCFAGFDKFRQGVQSFPKFPSAPLSREQSRISAAPSVTELASQSVASMGSLLGQQSVSGPSRPGSAVANNRGGQVSSAVAVGQAADRFTTRFMKDIVDARRNLDAFEKHWPEILAKLATNSLT